MGYILPIKQFQYEQYHQRVISKKQNSFHIESPFKALLDKHHQQLSKSYERLYKEGYDRYAMKPTKPSELEFAKMTGKGKRISSTI